MAKVFNVTFICIAGEITEDRIVDFNKNCANVCCWSRDNMTMFRTNKLNDKTFLLSEIIDYIQDVKVLECADGVLPID